MDGPSIEAVVTFDGEGGYDVSYMVTSGTVCTDDELVTCYGVADTLEGAIEHYREYVAWRLVAAAFKGAKGTD